MVFELNLYIHFNLFVEVYDVTGANITKKQWEQIANCWVVLDTKEVDRYVAVKGNIILGFFFKLVKFRNLLSLCEVNTFLEEMEEKKSTELEDDDIFYEFDDVVGDLEGKKVGNDVLLK